MATFVVAFFLIYFPTSTLIGWIDYKRGAVPVDQAIAVLANPFFKDLSKAIIYLAEGKNEEAVKTMKKWT